MGQIFSAVCDNGYCVYHTRLHEGVGIRKHAELQRFQEAILSGEIKNECAAELLKNGAELRANGIYLCTHCKELKENDTYYIAYNREDGPNDAILFDEAFPFGDPTCDVCKGKLTLIKNILSSDLKCPKCNWPIDISISGFFD